MLFYTKIVILYISNHCHATDIYTVQNIPYVIKKNIVLPLSSPIAFAIVTANEKHKKQNKARTLRPCLVGQNLVDLLGQLPFTKDLTGKSI